MLQLNHANSTIRINQVVHVHQYILIKDTKLVDRFLGHHNVKAHGVKKLPRRSKLLKKCKNYICWLLDGLQIVYRPQPRVKWKSFLKPFPTRFPAAFPATFPAAFSAAFPTRFPTAFPTRFLTIFSNSSSHKISHSIFHKISHRISQAGCWLGSSLSPISNAKFPPTTALLNRPTYNKSANVSPPPFPQISWEPQINE